jgi:hypothetical protein
MDQRKLILIFSVIGLLVLGSCSLSKKMDLDTGYMANNSFNREVMPDDTAKQHKQPVSRPIEIKTQSALPDLPSISVNKDQVMQASGNEDGTHEVLLVTNSNQYQSSSSTLTLDEKIAIKSLVKDQVDRIKAENKVRKEIVQSPVAQQAREAESKLGLIVGFASVIIGILAVLVSRRKFTSQKLLMLGMLFVLTGLGFIILNALTLF